MAKKITPLKTIRNVLYFDTIIFLSILKIRCFIAIEALMAGQLGHMKVQLKLGTSKIML